MWPDGRIACLWLPQLPLRIEVLRQPGWDGHPLILGAATSRPQVVQLCSPEAERAGVSPGLPLREALALCPDAIVVQPDPVRVAAVLETVLARLLQISPAVEPTGERFFLDLQGLKELYHGDLARLERALRAAAPALLRPRLGIGSGKFVAAVAARLAAPAGVRVVPVRATAALLAPLPVDELPLAPDTVERLHLLGLRTIGAVAALPFSAMQAEFGAPGARAWRLAHGRDDEPLVPCRVSPAIEVSLRVDDPLASVDALLTAVDQLLAAALAHPERRGRAARQLRLRALLADGTSWEQLATLKEASASRELLRRVLKSKLERPPPAPVEELSLELLGLGGEVLKQPSLFATLGARGRRRRGQLHGYGLPLPEQIAEAIRQLRARYGWVPVYHAVEVEPWSRIPERRWALVPCDV